jgi:hypothetical protein
LRLLRSIGCPFFFFAIISAGSCGQSIDAKTSCRVVYIRYTSD